MSFENRYGLADRVLHRLAFSTGSALTAVSDIEDRLYASKLDDISIEHPVFVTGLPRAGTTTLLNLLVDTGGFASHTYREMPFVLTPLLWHQLRGRLSIDDTPRERAHQDGIFVSFNSPEALEEMIWMVFWRDRYKKDHIAPLNHCNDEQFLTFFRQHMAKIILLRGGGKMLRYVSKNNLNISRLKAFPSAFSDCTVIVPYRDPLQQAASLLNQHLHFLKMHQDDKFASRYMAGVGHFDFGANLRPVNFDGWLDADISLDPKTLTFWLAYWVAAYDYVLKLAKEPVVLLSYDKLTADPAPNLKWLASVCALEDEIQLTSLAGRLRAPREHAIDTTAIDAKLLDQARDLQHRLEKSSSELLKS